MKVLVVDGFGTSEWGRRMARGLERAVRGAVKELSVREVHAAEIVVCGVGALAAQGLIPRDSRSEAVFDGIDLIFVDGDERLLPWRDAHWARFVMLCLATRKRLFAGGAAALAVACVSSVGNRCLQVMADPPPKEDDESWPVKIEGSDYYVRDASGLFTPKGSLGIRRMARTQALDVPQREMPHLEAARTGLGSKSRFSHSAKLGESKTKVLPVAHAAVARVPRTFVTACSAPWTVVPTPRLTVLAEDSRGPQVFVVDRCWAARGHASASDAVATILLNFATHMYETALLTDDNPSCSTPNVLGRLSPSLPPSTCRKLLPTLKTTTTTVPVQHGSQTARGRLETSDVPPPAQEAPVVVLVPPKSTQPYCSYLKRRRKHKESGFYSIVNDGPYVAAAERARLEARASRARWVDPEGRNFRATSGVASRLPLRTAGGVAASGPFYAAHTVVGRMEDKSKFVSTPGWHPVADRQQVQPVAS